MSSKDICRMCSGSGEAYYHPDSTGGNDSAPYYASCAFCLGSGFESSPTIREMRSSSQRIEAALAALDEAVAVLEKMLGPFIKKEG